MTKSKSIILTVLLIGASINLSWACGHRPPPKPTPPQVWVVDHGIDAITGLRNLWLGVEINPVLFAITQPTICTCGLGIGGAGLPLIASLNVTQAMVAVTNTVTHAITPVSGFILQPDAAISTHSASNALLSGQQWSGFSTVVNSFVQPIYAANEVLKIWYNIEIEPLDLTSFRRATRGKLQGFSIGGDPSDPLHAPEQFVGRAVSEPASAGLFAIGLIFMFRRAFKQRKNRV
jgi:hypothetical protein